MEPSLCTGITLLITIDCPRRVAKFTRTTIVTPCLAVHTFRGRICSFSTLFTSNVHHPLFRDITVLTLTTRITRAVVNQLGVESCFTRCAFALAKLAHLSWSARLARFRSGSLVHEKTGVTLVTDSSTYFTRFGCCVVTTGHTGSLIEFTVKCILWAQVADLTTQIGSSTAWWTRDTGYTARCRCVRPIFATLTTFIFSFTFVSFLTIFPFLS